LARLIVLIPHLFWLAGAIKFRNDYSPPSWLLHPINVDHTVKDLMTFVKC